MSKTIFDQNYDEMVKNRLRKLEMSQEDLAERTGITRPTLLRYRKNPRTMPMGAFQTILRALDITEDATVLEMYHATQR